MPFGLWAQMGPIKESCTGWRWRFLSWNGQFWGRKSGPL